MVTFVAVTGYTNVKLPKRGTQKSAGYDFYSREDVTILPGASHTFDTGVKVYMRDNVVLNIYPRSSIGFKKELMLKNTVSVIDADYVDNPKNEGNIFIAYYNYGSIEQHIAIGDAIAQGIFTQYLLTDDDVAMAIRTGGIGSTDAEVSNAK